MSVEAWFSSFDSRALVCASAEVDSASAKCMRHLRPKCWSNARSEIGQRWPKSHERIAPIQPSSGRSSTNEQDALAAPTTNVDREHVLLARRSLPIPLRWPLQFALRERARNNLRPTRRHGTCGRTDLTRPVYDEDAPEATRRVCVCVTAPSRGTRVQMRPHEKPPNRLRRLIWALSKNALHDAVHEYCRSKLSFRARGGSRSELGRTKPIRHWPGFGRTRPNFGRTRHEIRPKTADAEWTSAQVWPRSAQIESGPVCVCSKVGRHRSECGRTGRRAVEQLQVSGPNLRIWGHSGTRVICPRFFLREPAQQRKAKSQKPRGRPRNTMMGNKARHMKLQERLCSGQARHTTSPDLEAHNMCRVVQQSFRASAVGGAWPLGGRVELAPNLAEF